MKITDFLKLCIEKNGCFWYDCNLFCGSVTLNEEIMDIVTENQDIVIKGNPGDSARRRGLLMTFLPMLALAVLFGILLGWMLGIVLQSIGWFILGVLMLISGGWWYSTHLIGRMRAYAKGARGEETVAAELNRLTGGWYLFHGIQLPGNRDIDHIAVGPTGIYLIETKCWSGKLSILDGRLWVNGRLPRTDPILQVRLLMHELQQAVPTLPKIKPILCLVSRNFIQGEINADEILVCSHQRLEQLMTQAPSIFEPNDTANYAQCLSQLKIEEL